MIHHLVFWKLKATEEGRLPTENAAEMVRLLRALPPLIPQVISLSAGADFAHTPASWDVALYTTFASRSDLQVYQDHPEHKKVGAYIQSVVSARSAVDYET